jgi:hypothetical protein
MSRVQAIQSQQFGGGGGRSVSAGGSGVSVGGGQPVESNYHGFSSGQSNGGSRVTNVYLTGPMYGFDDFTDKVVDTIRQAVNEQDVVIIGSNSRQASELVPA